VKAKRYRFKDLLLGKKSIPKFDERFDEASDKGEKMLRNVELNKMDGAINRFEKCQDKN
jgi:hypothetical protein